MKVKSNRSVIVDDDNHNHCSSDCYFCQLEQETGKFYCVILNWPILLKMNGIYPARAEYCLAEFTDISG